MYNLVLSEQAQRDLARLDSPFRRQVEKRMDWLAEHADDIAAKALTGDWAGFFKLRAGDYRILYQVKGETVLVLRIRHRREVYE
jgi:mRNA interferase RelE/StbE